MEGCPQGDERPVSLYPQRHVDQPDQDRHLHQRADDCYKALSGIQPEDRDSPRSRQLEVVGGCREGQGRRPCIIRPTRWDSQNETKNIKTK